MFSQLLITVARGFCCSHCSGVRVVGGILCHGGVRTIMPIAKHLERSIVQARFCLLTLEGCCFPPWQGVFCGAMICISQKFRAAAPNISIFCNRRPRPEGSPSSVQWSNVWMCKRQTLLSGSESYPFRFFDLVLVLF